MALADILLCGVLGETICTTVTEHTTRTIILSSTQTHWLNSSSVSCWLAVIKHSVGKFWHFCCVRETLFGLFHAFQIWGYCTGQWLIKGKPNIKHLSENAGPLSDRTEQLRIDLQWPFPLRVKMDPNHASKMSPDLLSQGVNKNSSFIYIFKT